MKIEKYNFYWMNPSCNLIWCTSNVRKITFVCLGTDSQLVWIAKVPLMSMEVHWVTPSGDLPPSDCAEAEAKKPQQPLEFHRICGHSQTSEVDKWAIFIRESIQIKQYFFFFAEKKPSKSPNTTSNLRNKPKESQHLKLKNQHSQWVLPVSSYLQWKPTDW